MSSNRKNVKPRVLIVDDDTLVVDLIAESLRDIFDIGFALTAKDAMAQIQSGLMPDLILLDVLLPDKKGFEVCRQLKSNQSTYHIPVIFVTAKSEVKDKTKGFELGAVDFVTKPIELPVLKARVKTHIALKKNLEKLEELSLTDPLTELANKRHYSDTFKAEWKRAKRKKSALSLLVIDVDDFKKFNDNYGHGKGDECLQFIAELLLDSITRSTDFAARIGGEEFAILLPDTDESGAESVAKTILSHFASEQYPHDYSTVTDHLTVSIGIATTHPSKNNSPDEHFDHADSALYKAKERGKNQFYLYKSQD